MRFKKLLIGITATTAALGAGSGIAFAVWSVSGSGSGAGAASVAQSLDRHARDPVRGRMRRCTRVGRPGRSS